MTQSHIIIRTSIHYRTKDILTITLFIVCLSSYDFLLPEVRIFHLTVGTLNIIRIFYREVGDRSFATRVKRFSFFPIVPQIRSNRTGTPTFTPRIRIVFTVARRTNTECQAPLVAITYCAIGETIPRRHRRHLDVPNLFRIFTISIPITTCIVQILYIIVVAGSILVRIRPQETEIIYQRVSRVIHTIVNP